MQFKLDIVAPPAEVAALVNTFYVIETQDARIEEIVPAYSAQLVVMIRGRLLPAETIFSAKQIAALHATAEKCAAGGLAVADLCAQIAELLAAPRFTLRPDHAAVVEAIMRWLGSGFDPALDALYSSVDISPRQLQRLSRRFFGVPPAQVLKRFRAIRAAMVLANPALPDAMRDQMLASFFDQAHLIHDIRRYTGRTPTQLRGKSLSSGLLDPSGHGDAAGLLRGEDASQA